MSLQSMHKDDAVSLGQYMNELRVHIVDSLHLRLCLRLVKNGEACVRDRLYKLRHPARSSRHMRQAEVQALSTCGAMWQSTHHVHRNAV